MPRQNYELDLAEAIAQATDCKIVSVQLNIDEPGCMCVDIAGPVGSAQGSNGPTRKVYSISRRKVGDNFELWATGDIPGLDTIRNITFAEHLLYTRVVDFPAHLRPVVLHRDH